MDRRRAASLLALAACIACSAAAPTANNQTALDLYDKDTSEGCYYNFQHYGEGDRIMTNEPCLNCTCHNRMLMCYLRVCPFTKAIGQDCTVEKRADQCCPIVTCPDVPVDLLTSTSTSSPAEYGSTGVGRLDRFGCMINGRFLPEGSKVPPTPNKPCEHCYCIRNMTTCVMQECTLHVDGCTPIYHKDVCCPVRYSCDHTEDEIPLLDDMTTTVRPTPGFLLTTTTIPSVTQIPQDCVHDDEVFPDGSLIKTEKACEHCYCMKGDIVCVVQECGTPMENEGKNCTSLPPREGQCCPDTYICEGDNELPDDESTTIPPRRPDLEGSGYRIEPDAATVSPSEPEGSGEELSPEMYGTTIEPDNMIKEHYPSYSTPSESETEVTSEPDKGENTVPIDSSEEKSTKLPFGTRDKPGETTKMPKFEDELITEFVPLSSTIKLEEETVSTKLGVESTTSQLGTTSPEQEFISTTISRETTEEEYEAAQTTESNKTPKEEEPATTSRTEQITEREVLSTSKEEYVTESLPKTTKLEEITSMRSDEFVPTSLTASVTEKVTEQSDIGVKPLETEPEMINTTDERTTLEPTETDEQKIMETTVPVTTQSSKEYVSSSEGTTMTVPKVSEPTVEHSTVKPSEEQFVDTTTTTEISSDTAPTAQDSETPKSTDELTATEPTKKITEPTDEVQTEQSTELDVTKSSSDTTELTPEKQKPQPSDDQTATDITTVNTISESELPTTIVEPNIPVTSPTSTQPEETKTQPSDSTSTMSTEMQENEIITEKPSADEEITDSSQPMITNAVTEPSSKITQLLDEIQTPESFVTSADHKTTDKEPATTEKAVEVEKPEMTSPTQKPKSEMTTSEQPEIIIESLATSTQTETSYESETQKSELDSTLKTTIEVATEPTIKKTDTPIEMISFTEPSQPMETSNDTEITGPPIQSMGTKETSEPTEYSVTETGPISADTTDATLMSTSSQDEMTEVQDSDKITPTSSETSRPSYETETTMTESVTTEAVKDQTFPEEIVSPVSNEQTVTTDKKILITPTTETNLDISSTDISVKAQDEDVASDTISTTPRSQQEDITSKQTTITEFTTETKTEKSYITSENDSSTILPQPTLTDCGVSGCESGKPVPEEGDSETSTPGESCGDDDCKDMKTVVTTIKEEQILVTTEPSPRKEDIGTTFMESITEETSDVFKATTMLSEPGAPETTDKQVTISDHSPVLTETDDQSSTSAPMLFDITAQQTNDKLETTLHPDFESSTIVPGPAVIPGEGNCLVDGKTYHNDSEIPSSDKCQTNCRCVSSIVKCDPIMCSLPPDDMINCQAVYDTADTCCPTYVCDPTKETVPPQPHSQMSGTESPVKQPDTPQLPFSVECQDEDCTSKTSHSKCDGNGQCEENVTSSVDTSPSSQEPTPECTGENCKSDTSSSACDGAECVQVSVQPACEDGQNCDTVSPVNIPIQICEGEACQGIEPVLQEKPTEQDGKLDNKFGSPCSDESCTTDTKSSTLSSIDSKIYTTESVTSAAEEKTTTSTTQELLHMITESASPTILTESPVTLPEDEATIVTSEQFEHKTTRIIETTDDKVSSMLEKPTTSAYPSKDIESVSTTMQPGDAVVPAECTGESCVKVDNAATTLSSTEINQQTTGEPADCTGESCVKDYTGKPAECSGESCVKVDVAATTPSSTEIDQQTTGEPAECSGESCVKVDVAATTPSSTEIDQQTTGEPAECTGESCDKVDTTATTPSSTEIDQQTIGEPAECSGESCDKVDVGEPAECTGESCVKVDTAATTPSSTEIDQQTTGEPAECTGETCVKVDAGKPVECTGESCVKVDAGKPVECTGESCVKVDTAATTASSTEIDQQTTGEPAECSGESCDKVDVGEPVECTGESCVKVDTAATTPSSTEIDNQTTGKPAECTGETCVKVDAGKPVECTGESCVKVDTAATTPSSTEIDQQTTGEPAECTGESCVKVNTAATTASSTEIDQQTTGEPAECSGESCNKVDVGEPIECTGESCVKVDTAATTPSSTEMDQQTTGEPAECSGESCDKLDVGEPVECTGESCVKVETAATTPSSTEIDQQTTEEPAECTGELCVKVAAGETVECTNGSCVKVDTAATTPSSTEIDQQTGEPAECTGESCVKVDVAATTPSSTEMDQQTTGEPAECSGESCVKVDVAATTPSSTEIDQQTTGESAACSGESCDKVDTSASTPSSIEIDQQTTGEPAECSGESCVKVDVAATTPSSTEIDQQTTGESAACSGESCDKVDTAASTPSSIEIDQQTTGEPVKCTGDSCVKADVGETVECTGESCVKVDTAATTPSSTEIDQQTTGEPAECTGELCVKVAAGETVECTNESCVKVDTAATTPSSTEIDQQTIGEPVECTGESCVKVDTAATTPPSTEIDQQTTGEPGECTGESCVKVDTAATTPSNTEIDQQTTGEPAECTGESCVKVDAGKPVECTGESCVKVDTAATTLSSTEINQQTTGEPAECTGESCDKDYTEEPAECTGESCVKVDVAATTPSSTEIDQQTTGEPAECSGESCVKVDVAATTPSSAEIDQQTTEEPAECSGESCDKIDTTATTPSSTEINKKTAATSFTEVTRMPEESETVSLPDQEIDNLTTESGTHETDVQVTNEPDKTVTMTSPSLQTVQLATESTTIEATDGKLTETPEQDETKPAEIITEGKDILQPTTELQETSDKYKTTIVPFSSTLSIEQSTTADEESFEDKIASTTEHISPTESDRRDTTEKPVQESSSESVQSTLMMYETDEKTIQSEIPNEGQTELSEDITEKMYTSTVTSKLSEDGVTTTKPETTDSEYIGTDTEQKEPSSSIPDVPVIVQESSSIAPDIQPTTQFMIDTKSPLSTTEKSIMSTETMEQVTEKTVSPTEKPTETSGSEPTDLSATVTHETISDLEHSTTQATEKILEADLKPDVTISASTESIPPQPESETIKPELSSTTTSDIDIPTASSYQTTESESKITEVVPEQEIPSEAVSTKVPETVVDAKQSEPTVQENNTESTETATTLLPDISSHSETTPYLVELEEHTHKEEIVTTELPELMSMLTESIPTDQEPVETTEIPSSYTTSEEKETIEQTSTPVVTLLDELDNTFGETPEPSLVTERQPTDSDESLRLSTVFPEFQGPQASTSQPVTEQAVETTETKRTPDEEQTVATTTEKVAPEEATTPAQFDKYTKPEPLPTTEKAAETDRPSLGGMPIEEESSPAEEPFPASEPETGYGQEPDYVEEDQAFGPGTCRYGGKVYVSAQQIPRDDPCDFCFCFRSDIICLQQSCPPPIHGCHEEPIQGFCCPRYECPVSMATTMNVTTTTTTTTTTLPPHFLPHAYKGAAQRKGCQIKGHAYKVGEVVRASSGPCLHCTCGGDGQMKCDPKVCTPEPMLRQMIAAAVSSKRRR